MSRYIDAEWLLDFFEPYPNDYQTPLGSLRACVDDAPSIDIVRCQDCKYWVHNFNGCARNPCTEPWYATDFCNYGEREDE